MNDQHGEGNCIERQAEQIEAQITSFLMQRISLRKLVANIDGLLSVIENATEIWQTEIRADWWTLEQVNAAVASRDDPNFSDYETSLVSEALTAMQTSIAKRSKS